MTLTRDNYEAINRQIESSLAVVSQGQLSAHLSDDMREFKQVREGLGGSVHPSLDIDRSHIPEGSARWIAIRDPGMNRIVGVSAARLYINESVEHLLHARLIWGDRNHPADAIAPIGYEWSDEVSRLHGRLVLGGGAYLDRRYKGQNVGKAMAALLHAICLRLWNPDYFFNLMVVEKLSSKVHPERFGYRHTSVLFDAESKPDWGPANNCEIINWKSREEELAAYPVFDDQRAA